jgi:Xaa-Pro aminopeptidase
MLINRVAAARDILLRYGIDAILFTDMKDIRYLSGFTGSEAVLLVGMSENILLTDSRYVTQAASEVSVCSVVESRDKAKDIAEQVVPAGVRKLGFQPERVSVAFYNDLLQFLPQVELVSLGPEIGGLRVVKDDLEMLQLAKVAEIASEAFLDILSDIQPGKIERDVALKLEFAMRSKGADDKSFDFIVASGERGALPHGRASSRAIRTGELVTIDFGAVLDGYHSDETVTVSVGPPGIRQREIYQIVKDAHDMAIDAIRPGVGLQELDAVARNHILHHGCGDYFGHGLGHGVGLDVHEKPSVSFRGVGVIQEGMVFTIEPGIYIPGWGGVRIEDTVCVTGDGCRLLTRVPKDLIIV